MMACFNPMVIEKNWMNKTYLFQLHLNDPFYVDAQKSREMYIFMLSSFQRSFLCWCTKFWWKAHKFDFNHISKIFFILMHKSPMVVIFSNVICHYKRNFM
jgi:hypothetical protein